MQRLDEFLDLLNALSGIFGKSRGAVAIGIAFTFTLRFLCHLVTGAWIWGVWMPEQFMGLPMTNPWIYSFLYNGWYMVAELILTGCTCVNRPADSLTISEYRLPAVVRSSTVITREYGISSSSLMPLPSTSSSSSQPSSSHSSSQKSSKT